MVESGISDVMPILVIPVAFCSACKLCLHAQRERCWLELFPLIIIELNTIYMWTCKGFAVFDVVNRDYNQTNYRD